MPRFGGLAPIQGYWLFYSHPLAACTQLSQSRLAPSPLPGSHACTLWVWVALDRSVRNGNGEEGGGYWCGQGGSMAERVQEGDRRVRGFGGPRSWRTFDRAGVEEGEGRMLRKSSRW
ncbi:uncharacterized protein [Physcomitrium patens]|uniref:uncharacterized protein n=1 Tax=Physcomitrium patens TaxID=3218 RepID=UPI003CCDB13D